MGEAQLSVQCKGKTNEAKQKDKMAKQAKTMHLRPM
jgi:hypothetical protein